MPVRKRTKPIITPGLFKSMKKAGVPKKKILNSCVLVEREKLPNRLKKKKVA